MPDQQLLMELARQIMAINDSCRTAILIVKAVSTVHEGLENEVLRLRAVNGDLHGQVGMLAARVEEMEGEGQKREAKSKSRRAERNRE